MIGIPSLINVKEDETRRVINDIISFIKSLDKDIQIITRSKDKNKTRLNEIDIRSYFYPINTWILGLEE